MSILPSPTVSLAARLRHLPLPRTGVLLAIPTLLGLLHHTDHVLRADHSGWPFTAHVTPFTYSLLVYPLLLSIIALRHRPWYRVAALAALLLVTQAAHILIETPADQFRTWATGGSQHVGTPFQPNLLGLQAPFLGGLAVAVALLLSLSILVALLGLLRDALGVDAVVDRRRGTPR